MKYNTHSRGVQRERKDVVVVQTFLFSLCPDSLSNTFNTRTRISHRHTTTVLSVISLSLRHLSLLWQVYYYSNIIKQRASFPSSSYSYRPTCYATTTTTNCWPLHIHREMMITKKKKLFSYRDYNYRERERLYKSDKESFAGHPSSCCVPFFGLFCFSKS